MPFTLLVALLAAVSTATVLDNVSRSTKTHSYDPNAPDGPSHWGALPDSRTCATGHTQSPINIVTSDTSPVLNQKRRRPHPVLKKSLMSLHDKSYNWALSCEQLGACGSTTFKDTKYHLVNVHFHAPSEHTIDGKHAPLEMHMVHQTKNGKVAVVATLFKVGRANAVFERILNAKEEGEEQVTVKLPALVKQHNGYYTYKGSYTTPPCTQNVRWMIAKKRLHVSQMQLDRYIETAHIEQYGNNRPVQGMHERKVHRYGHF